MVGQKFLNILVVALGFSCAGNLSADQPSLRVASSKVVIIPIRGQIAKPELYILRRGLKQAIIDNVDTIVLDMETPGGSLEVTFEMLKILEKFPGKIVTYINREAISAGALISAGTDEIYFAPDGIIGAAAPVLSTGMEIENTMREKIVSYLKAKIRSMSEGKGYRGEVISAMIDMESELKIGDEVIKHKGKLLSLTANEAMKTYGDSPQPLLGTGIAKNIEALLHQLHGAGNYSVKNIEVTWSERLAQYLTQITPILLGIGLVCLFVEFKTPGFGIFGISGMTLLGLIFFGHFIAGFSGYEPGIFFLLGLILIAAELFFFPGVMLLAVSGVTLMLVSLVWAMTDLWPSEPILISHNVFMMPLISVLSGVVLAVILSVALLKYLPNGGPWNRMILHAAVSGEPVLANTAGLLGKTGIAVTALFPSGQVDISGCRYEARLAIGFAEAGTQVIVTDTAEFSLIVEVLS